MKMKKYLSLFLCLGLLLTLLAGCGAKSTSETMMAYGNGAVMEAAEAPAAMADAASGTMRGEASDSSTTALPESRKWIITVNLAAETEDLDALTAALDDKIAGLNGYVENQSIYNGSSYNGGRRYRSASLTIRIPADQVDVFTQDVDGIANIVRRTKNLEDVTLSYVATESRLNALETEEARLLELLAQAETMSDLLEIESRLTDVRYELENVASQKRLYDNQIDYATIYLTIDEVQEYTPVEEPTLWERISKGFTGSLKGLGDDLLDLLVWIIVSSPYLVVLALVVLVVVLLVKRARRRRTVKSAPRKDVKAPENKDKQE